MVRGVVQCASCAESGFSAKAPQKKCFFGGMMNMSDNINCSCGCQIFKIEYVENYCECGEAFRLFCCQCGKEQDWHAKGNKRGFRNLDLSLKEIIERKKRMEVSKE